jgi:hypothetical protein
MDQKVFMYRIRPDHFDSLSTGYQVLTGKHQHNASKNRLRRHADIECIANIRTTSAEERSSRIPQATGCK